MGRGKSKIKKKTRRLKEKKDFNEKKIQQFKELNQKLSKQQS